jgi:hypothetical protein
MYGKKVLFSLVIYLSIACFSYAAKFETNTFLLNYPDNWIPAYMEPKLTLIPEDNVVIEVDARDVQSISSDILKIKKKKGIYQPANLIDVLNYTYAKELLNTGWRPYKAPKIKKVGGYKTINCEFEREENNEYISLYIFERENVFAFILKAKSPDLFENYKSIVYSLIANNFSAKSGNPIYMVIGMTIAYIASFIGLISAYFYYKRRQGGLQ